ncbi:hypothetical protein ACIPVB_04775 [Microbacterium sp. NPDC090007]|uniref:hypothetical protein n=1 Tax=Microbacterium sp. NPDC090007 TaxID=3364204 RepID=UPI00382E71E5
MKTTILRAIVAVSIAAAAVMAPTAANAYVDPVTVIATPSVIPAGGQTTFTTSRPALQGDEDILISITGTNANGVTLASVVQTNTSLRSKAVNGDLRVPVTFPQNARGRYDVTFTGARSGTVLRGSVTVTGSPSSPAKGGLAVTGFDASTSTGIWLAGTGLVVAGGAVVAGAAVRRRRRTTHR